ncbi:MAG: hypothetical protein ACRYF4_07555 [Janthinobacterium lividum]
MRSFPLSLPFVLTVVGLAPLKGQSLHVAGIRPQPQISIGDTLTIAATPSNVNFTLVPGGVASGSSPVTITTTYHTVGLLSSISLYASLGSTSAALSGGTPVYNIPSSSVFGKDPTGGTATSPTAFVQTNPVTGTGGSLKIANYNALITLTGTLTDVLSLTIDLTSLPQTPAGTYTGTLTLMAQAF